MLVTVNAGGVAEHAVVSAHLKWTPKVPAHETVGAINPAAITIAAIQR